MKESRKEFIREAHKAACSDWKKKIEKEFPSLFEKPKFDIGKWYKADIFGGISIGCYQGGRIDNSDIADAYGFDYEGTWIDKASFGFYKAYQNWQPATEKEVEEALKKEAKKRGFKMHNKTKGFDSEEISTILEEFEYDALSNELRVNCIGKFFKKRLIFKNGKWANILETITKEEAEKQLGKKIVD